MNDAEKTEQLYQLIDALCDKDFFENEHAIDEWKRKLTEIYSNGYRHSYSKLFYKLQEVIDKDSEISEILGENLNVFEKYLREDEFSDLDVSTKTNVLESYKKFADHIKLEIGRNNVIYSRMMSSQGIDSSALQLSDKKELEDKLQKLTEDLNIIRPAATQAQKILDNVEAKMENDKISSITTLTIFSAVVLAFSGGITFEAGMLEGMSTSSPYRLVFTIALTGFILFNTIFSLLYLVGKMAGKTISTKCKYLKISDDAEKGCESCGDGYCIKPYNRVSIFCRITHKYSYVLAVNLVLVLTMYVDFWLWILYRNQLDIQTVVLLVALPTILLLIVCVGKFLARRKQRKKNILFCKVELLERMLYPKNESWIENFGKMLSEAFGGKKSSVEENYKEFVEQYKNVRFFKVQRILRGTKWFVKRNIIEGKLKTRIVSGEQYKLNKRKWKMLKKDLKRYIKDSIENEVAEDENHISV